MAQIDRGRGVPRLSASGSTRILIERRRRERARANRVRPWFWLFQGTAALLLALFLTVGGAVGVAVASVFAIYSFYAAQLPDAGVIERQQEKFETIRFYDRTGEHLLYESVDPRPFRGDRTYMPLQEMAPAVTQASVALEDHNFWDNPGINVRGLFRAFISNLQGGGVQGGSSITQQLVKNVVIPVEERAQQSYARKLKEVILALEVTRRYDKGRILEWYLNYNFYGNLAYGIEAASQVYFGKSVSELDVAEAAMLAPIPQFPALNPIDNPEDAKIRQGVTLQVMVDAGYLTQAEADAAFAQELDVRGSVAERFDIITAPHFALYALERIKEEFNTVDDPYRIWKEGLTVYTTLDVQLQQYAEQVARTHIARLNEQGRNVNNASVVVLKPDTGEILAMVGSLDYNNEEIDGQVNVAISERQPGSSFKPYVYLSGLLQGMTPASLILDVRTAFTQNDNSVYVPENYDRLYHGPVSLREALAQSLNIPAIRVMDQVGVASALRTAHRMGINGLDRGLNYYGLNLVLGGGEVTLLDHTYAYSVLANGGVMAGQPVPPDSLRSGFRNLDPVAILQVRNTAGAVLMKYERPEVERIISADAQYVLVDIMSDNLARAPMFGINNNLVLSDRRVSAKTGTTNGWKDAWTVGFTPQLTVGVWIGNTDNESMNNVTGASGAAPIWKSVMERYHQGVPPRWYARPPNVVNQTVCQPSGLLPSPDCQRQRQELFIAGTEPKVEDNLWQSFEIDKRNQLLAKGSTPDEERETKVYLILPPEAEDWVKSSGIEQPPQGQSPDDFIDFPDDVAITFPPPGGYIGGQVEILGNARGGNFANYRLEYGSGPNPTQWTQIGPENGTQHHNGLLEVFNTEGLEEGQYTLRLTVRYHDGNQRDWKAPITIDNTPPTVEINEPEQDSLYVMDEDDQININALVSDEWAMDRVEFAIDATYFITRTAAPYNERWPLELRYEQVEVPGETRNWPAFASDDEEIRPGRMRELEDGFTVIFSGSGIYLEGHLIKVRAYDRAGNETESDEIRVYVRQPRKE